MDDVMKLVGIGLCAGIAICAVILSWPVARDQEMLWSLLITLEIAVLVVSVGVSVAVAAGLLSIFLRHRTAYEDRRGEVQVTVSRGRALDARTMNVLDRPADQPPARYFPTIRELMGQVGPEDMYDPALPPGDASLYQNGTHDE